MRAIPSLRLATQHLATPALTPASLVAAFGAMQAQEYEPAKWAVGLRAPGTTEADIEDLLADGAILRSHPMRGTHHFVAREDLRWLMALMGPIMIARSARRNRELELDEKTLAKCMRVIARALEGGTHLTRKEVAAVLARAKIETDGQRIAHIIYRAELESLVCSGRRSGKQITLALFDERVPASKPRPREEALADLATRYFTTRGPATLADFTWWCQLPAADAREAVRLAQGLVSETIDGTSYYRAPSAKPRSTPRALLLPPFDEYTVAYRDRSAIGRAPAHATAFIETSLLGPLIILAGKAAGTWHRTMTADSVTITLSPWRTLTAREKADIATAAKRHARFLGKQLTR